MCRPSPGFNFDLYKSFNDDCRFEVSEEVYSKIVKTCEAHPSKPHEVGNDV